MNERANGMIKMIKLLGFVFLCLIPLVSTAEVLSLKGSVSYGDVSSNIRLSFEGIAYLVSASSYLGGMSLAIASILKFKQHKENPTQIPIGTPLAIILIASALIFMPSVLGALAHTLFGTSGTVGGLNGTLYNSGTTAVTKIEAINHWV